MMDYVVDRDDTAGQRATEAAHGTAQALGEQIAAKIVRFQDLARCGEEVWIEHSGQLYRLRQTRQGKLILTK